MIKNETTQATNNNEDSTMTTTTTTTDNTNNGIIENGTITVAVVEQISECGAPVNVIEHITRKYTIRKNNDHGRSGGNRQYIISYKGQRHTVAFLYELTCIDVSAGY